MKTKSLDSLSPDELSKRIDAMTDFLESTQNPTVRDDAMKSIELLREARDRVEARQGGNASNEPEDEEWT
jgi:hypothetical protein